MIRARDRTVRRRLWCLTAGAALASLGGIVVTRVQSFIVWERLMTLVGFGPWTPLERGLLIVGGLALLASAWTSPRGGRRRDSIRVVVSEPLSLGVMCALWYGFAVVQWYLVLDVATTDGGASKVRDPTQIEPLLAVGAVCLLSTGVVRAVRRTGMHSR